MVGLKLSGPAAPVPTAVRGVSRSLGCLVGFGQLQFFLHVVTARGWGLFELMSVPHGGWRFEGELNADGRAVC